MPRLGQDQNFKLTELNGKYIQDFFGFQDPISIDVGMICLRVAEQTEWHYLFLDAGIGFWGKHSPDEMEEVFIEWEDDITLDLAQKFSLQEAQIIEAICEDRMLSQFRFTFEHGELIFCFENQKDIDSNTVISFKKH